MLGQVEVALRRERPSEEYRHVLAVVRTQAEHLRGIVEALLFLARADAEAEVTADEVDLAEWLPEHVAQWAHHPRAADVELRVTTPGPVAVRAQPLLLGQLLDNLLDNALKYGQPDTPVTVTVGREEGGVTVSVEDQGRGIAAEELGRVFEPFYRSADARRIGQAGSGLGLAVARRIATAFGGGLTAESEAGRGSRFVLRLPGPRRAARHGGSCVRGG
jgi:signal transduction histidine kinase